MTWFASWIAARTARLVWSFGWRSGSRSWARRGGMQRSRFGPSRCLTAPGSARRSRTDGGRRHIAQDPLRSPEADISRLHDRAVLEQASHDSAPVALTTSVGNLVGAQETSTAALDLALIDGRYRLDTIESCLHRLLGAWELASNGEPTALDRLAEPHAAQQLLRPERGLPTIIREPHLRKFRLAELNASAAPPQITVIASLRAHPDMWHLDICWRLTLVEATVNCPGSLPTRARGRTHTSTRPADPSHAAGLLRRSSGGRREQDLRSRRRRSAASQ